MIDSMREVALPDAWLPSERTTFAACVATILELPLEDVPEPTAGEDVAGWHVMRWLGGLGVGLVPIADATSFSWAGPWLGWVRSPVVNERRAVVMYGVPAGVVWDPSRATEADGWRLEGGFVVAALDIATARPILPEASISIGTIAALYVAQEAGVPVQAVESVRVLAGHGLEGDRHMVSKGTFPSGVPGSALTLIENEVCASFAPPLEANEHRRNVVTLGIDLNSLVGHEFLLGNVRCRGVRLCEPCTVIEGYASRPILRRLVHRGGLRADILENGEIHVGDAVRAAR